MSLDKRSQVILQELVVRKDYTSITGLMKRFNVSRRTIYNDIDKINYWLKQRDLNTVGYVRSRGFHLTTQTKEVLLDKYVLQDIQHYEYSADERIAWNALYLLISEDLVLIKDLSSNTHVSRNTVIDDLKKSRADFEKFHIEIHFHKKEGYILKGNESAKRKAIVYYLSYLLSDLENWESVLLKIKKLLQLQELKLDCFLDILHECEKGLQVHFTDDDIHQLALQLFLIGRRVMRAQFVTIDSVEKDVIKVTEEFHIAKKAIEQLSVIFSCAFPIDETYYLTTQLLSAKLQHKYNLFAGNQEFYLLKKAIDRMVSDFQVFAGVTLQNRQEIEDNLLIHLQPAYYRSKYGLKMQNPLTEMIKKKYGDIFLLTKKVIHHFEKLTEQPLHDDEIAFITIHFGGWLRKEGRDPIVRKKALIICNSGIGTSAILRKQLENLFPSIDFYGTVSAREYESEAPFLDVDFVVSTVSIRNDKHPLFVVNPILNEQEKISLVKKVHSIVGKQSETIRGFSFDSILEVIQLYADIKDEDGLKSGLKSYFNSNDANVPVVTRPNLLQLLSKNNIQIVEEVSNWQEAIKVAANPLIENRIIEEVYVDAMIRHVEKNGPYIIIAPEVALPHAKPEEGANGVGISMLVLKKPVFFSSESRHQVKVMFVLSSIDQVTHLRAMSELTALLSAGHNLEKLKRCTSVEEIWSILQKANNEKKEL